MDSPRSAVTVGSLAERGSSHRQYPPMFLRMPFLIGWYHTASHLGTLRNWYVRRRLREAVEGLAAGACVVDLGCGAGDHLFYAHRRRSDLRLVGIDRSAECIEICRSYAEHLGTRAEFIVRNLEDESALPPSDLTVCITVLHYVEGDLDVLRRVRSSLLPGGKILLYSPVRYERIVSRILDSRSRQYDVEHGRKRRYDAAPLCAMVEKAGFRIERIEEAYGTFGKIYFEMYELLLHGLRFTGLRYAALGVLILVSPILLTLMVLDYLLPVKRGNGVLVTAR